LVNRINAAAGQTWIPIDPETKVILDHCQQVFQITRGAFDPTVLPLEQLWNWQAQEPCDFNSFYFG
jgi:thiamine biosynthesis lipoprotein ApbE